MNTNETNNQSARVTPLQAKWGTALGEGFVVVPSALLRHQSELGLSDSEVVVLMNLFMSWWKPEDVPFPRASTLAKRMGVGSRTVLRHMARLEQKGLIQRLGRRSAKSEERTQTRYDLGGVVARLKAIGATPYQSAIVPSSDPIETEDYSVFL